LKSQEEPSYVFCGFPKSGNTWARFVIFNYFTLLQEDRATTLSYNELNSIQNNVLQHGTCFESQAGYPLFYRTHACVFKEMNVFDKRLFIHRNPLDTLISYYHWHVKRSPQFPDSPYHLRSRLVDKDFLIKTYLPVWLKHYRVSVPNADFVLNYSDMKKTPFEVFKNLFETLDWEVDTEKLKKAIELSDFKKVQKMGRETNQTQGMGIKSNSNSEHARSGQEGQFRFELKQETIDWAFQQMPEFKELYGNI
jgi:hypothetical protein